MRGAVAGRGKAFGRRKAGRASTGDRQGPMERRREFGTGQQASCSVSRAEAAVSGRLGGRLALRVRISGHDLTAPRERIAAPSQGAREGRQWPECDRSGEGSRPKREAAVRAALAIGHRSGSRPRLVGTGNARVARIGHGRGRRTPRDVSMQARVRPAIPPGSHATLLGSGPRAGAGAMLRVSLSLEI